MLGPPAAAPSRQQEDPACQVYVGNLPYNLRWQDLKDHMKQAGSCVNARILTVDGTDWGRSRGVGIVRYASEAEAQAAISQLNGSDLQGRPLVVDVWTGSSGKWQQERAERMQKVGAAEPEASQQAKPGDWICPFCKDLQFARNVSCRTCGVGGGGKGKAQESTVLANGQVARPGDWICPFCNDLQFARNAMCRNCGSGGKGCGGKGGFRKGGGGMGCGKGLGRGNQVHGENLVYVGNLSYEVSWQDLKDHMKQAGTVEFCSVLTEDGTDWGRSKGAGCVRFSTEAEVQQAISTLAESELKGRRILVDRWAAGKGAGK